MKPVENDQMSFDGQGCIMIGKPGNKRLVCQVTDASFCEQIVNRWNEHREQAAEILALRDALRDAISTYGPQPVILVTAERQEAWQAVLDGKDQP